MTNNLIQTVKAVLSTTPARWLSLVETVPTELLSRPPAAREWSALDCLKHLLDTEGVFPVRMQTLLAGQDIVAFDPDTQGSAREGWTPREFAAEFARLRTASLAKFGSVTNADLSHTGRHSELGPVTLEELLHEWAAHDLMHTVQAERALMQPFILGSGPWRLYFKDHDAAGDT